MRAHAERTKRFPVYAAMLYLGLAAALIVGDRLARSRGLDPVRVVTAFLVLIPVCLAGARALSVALDWSHYRAHRREILNLRRGGAAMYGALPPAIALSVPLLNRLGLPFGAFWDIGVVAILAGMVPTRFGCLGNGCCAGRPTSGWFGLRMVNSRGVRDRRFPNPLFEAGVGVALLVVAFLVWNRSPFPGAVALLLAAGYGAGRLALDGLREQRAPRAAGLGAYQWISIALIGIGVVGFGAGAIASNGASGASVPAGASSPGAAHLIASVLLLAPVVHLFRFLGCELIFELKDPVPKHSLQMIVLVPDLLTGAITVSMKFEVDGGAEIADSPFDIPFVGVQPDDRHLFELITDIPQGDSVVTCTVAQVGQITRIGTCSGMLSGPGLVLRFEAAKNDLPPILNEILCFEPAT